MVMWQMSDRAIPLNLCIIDGFGIHTFRWINDEGKATFVRYQWNPQLGVHSRVWDETLKVSGNDPDSQRKDLCEAIDEGNYPVWDFCVQLLPEEKEHDLTFDILDPTKVWPEEDIPKIKIREMIFNRNVDNYFAETEQVAFFIYSYCNMTSFWYYSIVVLPYFYVYYIYNYVGILSST